MSTQESWICNGTPQNGKEYPSLGFPHDPHENYSSDCEICGLPRESSVPKPPPIKPLLMALGFGGLALMLAGGGTFFVFANRCEPGFQRIEGQCIDLFQEPYELAKSEGNQAISLFNNYQSLEDLEKGEVYLQNAINQLQEIPYEAPIYPEASISIEDYEQHKKELVSLIASEKRAFEKLTELENKLNQAIKMSDQANNISQYKKAKELWQRVKKDLTSEDLKSGKLAFKKVQEYQDQCEWQIQCLENKINGGEDCCSIIPQPSYCLF